MTTTHCLEVRRLIRAPHDQVFAAFLEKDAAIMEHFAPDAGTGGPPMRSVLHESDPRVGGTTGIDEESAAGSMDVRIGGGPDTILPYPREGLIDDMHLAVAPVALGRDEPLLAGLDLPALGYEVVASTASERAMHVVPQCGGAGRPTDATEAA